MRKLTFVPRFAALCLAATASAALAQQNAIPLFTPVDNRDSLSNTSSSNPNDFNSTILNLSCTMLPVTATLSSTADGTGNVLVDNFISVDTGQGATDVCIGGVNDAQQNCFNQTWYNTGHYNIGVNPDTLVATNGVPPINISSLFSQGGAIKATIAMEDTGIVLTGSTLYLVTNCTSKGVTGPAQITGNPIPQSNPTPSQLSQSASFNSATDQNVQFTYNLNESQNNGNLTIVNGTTPITNDLPINPTNFSTTYLSGTSFSTASCIIHTGELYNGTPGCKMYTLTCQQGTNPDQAGALCPVSKERDEIFQESFDGPGFSLADHQGVGLLEAQDGWEGQSCSFDPASGLSNLLCPQNILTSFFGPGLYNSGGRGINPNSTFISVQPVLEPVTSYVVAGLQPGNWVKTPTTQVNFTVTPPSSTQNNFVAAPIQSLTYGTSSPSEVPPPDPPVSSDTVLTNPTQCPSPGSGSIHAGPYTPPAQSITLSDGEYLVHYLAEDCAGTEELKFTNPGSGWSTSFYTFALNVDTVPPEVASGPTLSPAPSTIGGVPNAYTQGTAVMATYSCSDALSGVVKCGTQTYAPVTTPNTPLISTPVNTSSLGTQTFTVNAQDAAGNTASNSVTYTVVAATPVNLSLVKLAPPSAKSGSQITYAIAAGNLGKQAATAPVITDVLPSGVSFVNASALQLVCTNKGCSNQASCSYSSNTVTCTAPSMTLLTPIAVSITVKLTAPAGSKITNTATITSGNPEGKGNPQSSATTTVTK
jgi:uncharacterized repeat protein (TIGR01451 family)